MEVRYIVGDVRESLDQVEDASIDCVIADPPYGETSLAWDKWPKGWPSLILPKLKPSGSMWCFGSLRMLLSNLPEFDRWRMSQEVIWEKPNGSSLLADRFYRVHEYALHFYPKSSMWRDVYKDPQYSYDAKRAVLSQGRADHYGIGPELVYSKDNEGKRLARSVLRCNRERGFHPTQKPAPLVSLLIQYACPPGGTVLDPFSGSGTTGLAASRLDRESVLIEVDPIYQEKARGRIESDAPLFRAM